jgi:hypothetical protein
MAQKGEINMYAIFEASMSGSGLRQIKTLGEFDTIEAAISKLRGDPAGVQFYEHDEDHDAADVVMSDGSIFAVQQTSS